jgi:hypothetical protein
VLPGMAVRNDTHRKGLVVRSLTPRLRRTLALVIRRDKPLHRGLKEVIHAMRALGQTAKA